MPRSWCSPRPAVADERRVVGDDHGAAPDGDWYAVDVGFVDGELGDEPGGKWRVPQHRGHIDDHDRDDCEWSSSASFRYRPSATGSPTLTVSATGYTSATQVETVS